MKKKELQADIIKLDLERRQLTIQIAKLEGASSVVIETLKKLQAAHAKHETEISALKKLLASRLTIHERLDSQAEALATCARRLEALEATK